MKLAAKLFWALLFIPCMLVSIFLFLMSFSPDTMSSVGACVVTWLIRICILTAPLIFVIPSNIVVRSIRWIFLLTLIFVLLFLLYESQIGQNKTRIIDTETKEKANTIAPFKTKQTKQSVHSLNRTPHKHSNSL